MPAPYILDTDKFTFPDPNLALTEPDGLLAIGGDLQPERLLEAYKHGIFPWYSDDQPIMWWSPNQRALLFFDNLIIARSLAKVLRKQQFTISIDQSFSEVITACSQPRKTANETWIQPEMIAAYIKMHTLGYAHSVEVWQDDKLVGGLYGLAIGKVFCGESMFSLVSNTAKIAMVYLVLMLKKMGYAFIDCQIQNPFLESMGVKEVDREKFLQLLHNNIMQEPLVSIWPSAPPLFGE